MTADGSTVLQVDSARFPSETLDGETIVLDVVSGHVYDFTGAGSVIWQSLVDGVSRAALTGHVDERYGREAADAVDRFLDRLVELAMVRRSPASGDTPLDDRGWPDEFVAPVVDAIDDVSQILTLDPIHDVDPEMGWPRAGG